MTMLMHMKTEVSRSMSARCDVYNSRSLPVQENTHQQSRTITLATGDSLISSSYQPKTINFQNGPSYLGRCSHLRPGRCCDSGQRGMFRHDADSSLQNDVLTRLQLRAAQDTVCGDYIGSCYENDCGGVFAEPSDQLGTCSTGTYAGW
jgi:hypothetical protein